MWAKFDATPIQRIVGELLNLKFADFRRKGEVPTGIKPVRSALMSGAAWALGFGYLLTLGHDFAAPALFAGFGIALLFDWAGRWQKSYALRAVALGFIIGCTAMMLAGALAIAIFKAPTH